MNRRFLPNANWGCNSQLQRAANVQFQEKSNIAAVNIRSIFGTYFSRSEHKGFTEKIMTHHYHAYRHIVFVSRRSDLQLFLMTDVNSLAAR